jgi:hypothetical protein
MPRVVDLVRGIHDATCPVHYTPPRVAGNWAEFRGLMNTMLASPVFGPERAQKIRDMLRPFDERFGAAGWGGEMGTAAARPVRMREHGLG